LIPHPSFIIASPHASSRQILKIKEGIVQYFGQSSDNDREAGHNWTLFETWYTAEDPYGINFGDGCVDEA
jgi:hypothetical protein